MIPYFSELRSREPRYVEPRAPPKIKETNQALTNRKKQLESYLKMLVKVSGDRMVTYPAPLMEFLFVNVIESNLIDYNFNAIENVIWNEESSVSITDRQVIILNGKPKVHYIVNAYYQDIYGL